MKEKIDFPAFTISLIEEGIVLAEIKAIKEMTVEHVEQLHSTLADLGKGKKVCLLTTFQGYIPMNEEVMAHSMKKEYRQRILASAIILKSAALRVAVTFFWSFHKPKEPKKIFQSKDKALAWLRKVKREALEKDLLLA